MNAVRGDGGIGRRNRLKICRWQHREGSTPSRPTNGLQEPVQLFSRRGHGFYVPPNATDFLDQAGYLPILSEIFYTARKAEGVSVGTLAYYREKASIFLSWCEACAVTQIQQVTPDLLRRFLLAMAETHNAGGVHGIYRGVRAFLRFCAAEEVVLGWQSPTRKVKAPRVELETIEGVSLADVAAMIVTCDKMFTGTRDAALLLALLDTGARVTEFLSVNLSDVGADGSITLRHTKAKKPRAVFLSTKTRRALHAWLRMRRDQPAPYGSLSKAIE
jgi:site-specific recombinase XerD